MQFPNGNFGFGPVFFSDPFGPNGDNSNVSVPMNLEGIEASWIVGSVHSHPAGSHRPSGARADGSRGDLDHFDWILSTMTASGRSPATGRIYIVAQNQLGANQTPYNQINVYNSLNIQKSQDEFLIGDEVNPDAEYCP